MSDDPITPEPTPTPDVAPAETLSAFFAPPEPAPEEPPAEAAPVDPAAPPAPEVPAEPGAEVPPVDPAAPAEPDPLERSYGDLAEKDRALQERMERVRGAESDLRTFQTLRETAAQDPAAAMRALGIDPMTLPERLLGIEPDEPATPPPAAGLSKAEASQMFSEQLTHQKQIWDEEQQFAQMIRSSDLPMLKDRIQRNPGLAAEIHKEAVKRYQDTQVVPDVGQLLQEHEDRAQANLFASFDKALEMDIIKKRYKIGGTETPAPTKLPPGAPPAATPTLTQALKEEPKTDEREMTEEEKWAVFVEGAKTLVPRD